MEAGTLLGEYRIERELGSGGMGSVYRAEGPDGTVAIKLVHQHMLDTADAVERFQREIEMGKTVHHANVVRTIDGGEANGRHYLAMEFVEGQTLNALRKEMKRVPEELCCHIAREVCRGLEAIHAAGAVHRDIKPENVIISLSAAKPDDGIAERPRTSGSRSTSNRDGNVPPKYDHVVKIMDLGVARSIDDALRLSQTGAFVGSLHYASPEQFLGGGKGLDGRVDLHALGLVLYELSSGQNPYYANGIPLVIRKVLHEEPRRLGDVNPQLSPFFEELVHKLLSKDPGGRFQTATEVLEVLTDGEDSAWWVKRATELQASVQRPLRRVRIPRETAVYGREEELAILRGLYEKARAGDGQVVLIEGEAGVGKSRLVDELIARLQKDEADLEFLFGSYPSSGAAFVSGAFCTAYREQFGVRGSARYLPQNQNLVPAFDALLKGEGTPPGAEALSDDSVQTCFLRTTQTLAKERVVVVLIDDLHFASEHGRRLFNALAHGTPGHRVLLVGTTRRRDAKDWSIPLLSLEHTTPLLLARLGPKDLVLLLEDSLGSNRLAQDLAIKIALKSDGNPFFVFEILRGLREAQMLTQTVEGTWLTSGVIEALEIPTSVLDLVNARVAGLSEDERDLLDVACCCGFEFDPSLIGDVLGIGRIPLLKRFGQIERAHRLVRAAGRHYVFDHHQVQEALYNTLHEQMREEYHAALAAALETRLKAADQDPSDLDGAACVEMCEHYLDGAQGDLAVRYRDAALHHLEQGYLSAIAVTMADRALAVPGLVVGAKRVELLLRKTERLDFISRREAKRAATIEALPPAEASGWLALRARVEMSLAPALIESGRLDEAREVLTRARELGSQAGDERIEGQAIGGLALVCREQRKYEEACDLAEQSLVLARKLGDAAAESRATASLALSLFARGRLAGALKNFEQHLAYVRDTADRPGEARALGNLASLLLALGDPEASCQRSEESIEICREVACQASEAHALETLGAAQATLGNSAVAEERLCEALALRRAVGSPSGMATTLQALGGFLAAQGRDDEAAPALREAVELARNEKEPVAWVLSACRLALLPEGDAAAARRTLEKNLAEMPKRARMEARFLLWQSASEFGDLDRAHRLLLGLRDEAPEASRDALVSNVPLHSTILAAWDAA